MIVPAFYLLRQDSFQATFPRSDDILINVLTVIGAAIRSSVVLYKTCDPELISALPIVEFHS